MIRQDGVHWRWLCMYCGKDPGEYMHRSYVVRAKQAHLRECVLALQARIRNLEARLTRSMR